MYECMGIIVYIIMYMYLINLELFTYFHHSSVSGFQTFSKTKYYNMPIAALKLVIDQGQVPLQVM